MADLVMFESVSAGIFILVYSVCLYNIAKFIRLSSLVCRAPSLMSNHSGSLSESELEKEFSDRSSQSGSASPSS